MHSSRTSCLRCWRCLLPVCSLMRYPALGQKCNAGKGIRPQHLCVPLSNTRLDDSSASTVTRISLGCLLIAAWPQIAIYSTEAPGTRMCMSLGYSCRASAGAQVPVFCRWSLAVTVCIYLFYFFSDDLDLPDTETRTGPCRFWVMVCDRLLRVAAQRGPSTQLPPRHHSHPWDPHALLLSSTWVRTARCATRD